MTIRQRRVADRSKLINSKSDYDSTTGILATLAVLVIILTGISFVTKSDIQAYQLEHCATVQGR